jgi:LCP family protein required for cell wall assembly
VAYNESRQRTRELNDIAPLEEGIEIVRVAELLLGLREPEAPGTDANVEPPEILRSTLSFVTPTPASSAPDASPESSPVDATAEPDATTSAGDSASSTPDAAETPDATGYQPWADPRRVTILLLGIDQRQGETGPFRTDTMILLSLDPVAKTGAILSIPRDLWVVYPAGLGEGRINNANVIGEIRQYPGGGPTFAKLTVEGLLGLTVDYYLLVNFDAFITFVNAIGEVEVCPPAPIDDPKYPDGSYGYKPIHFDAGCQFLNAERLLEYARTRATSGGDVDRAGRQQEVMFAVRARILSVGGASGLLGRAETIWESVSQNVQTDMSFRDLIELSLLAEEVPGENIRNGAISYEHVRLGTAADGEQILIPIVTDILALIEELFRVPG